MEIADIYALNKCDQPGADRVERELHADAAERPIIRTVATEGKGITELLAAIDAAAKHWGGPPGPRPTPRPAAHSALTIDHLGIAVASLGSAIPFYESLGLRVSHREIVEAEKVAVAMLPTTDSRLELLEPTSPDSSISKFLEKRGPGLHHVALRVPDLASAVTSLKAAGARLLNEPRTGAGGHRYVFIHPASTGGVLLELIQDESGPTQEHSR
jgi:LAO/AO transport system kinase